MKQKDEYIHELELKIEALTQAHQQAVKELNQRKGWQHCKTHEKINANYAWGCPYCVHELRHALAVAIHELECSGLAFDHPLLKRLEKALPPKFAVTSCSQCGKEFGPGNSGYSHCDQHKTLATHKETGEDQR